jgi:hypothetical protein
MNGLRVRFAIALASLAAVACGIVRPSENDSSGGRSAAPFVDASIFDAVATSDATDAGEPLCTPSGWCWVNPTPQGNALVGVWASGPSDVWAVGGMGTILHWDGSHWSVSDSGSIANLWSVWGSGPNDIWATGDGPGLHWDGNAWSPVSAIAGSTVADFTGTAANVVWGSGPDDVWNVQSWTSNGPVPSPTFKHWDGHSWSQESVGDSGDGWILLPTDAGYNLLRDIQAGWSSGPNDAWAVGQAVIHWDGAAWSAFPAPEAPDGTKAIWGSGPADVWMVGDYGFVAHWDGTAWTQRDAGVGAPPLSEHRITLTSVSGSSWNDVWFAGTQNDAPDGDTGSVLIHWDGTTFKQTTFPDVVVALELASTGEGWAVGDDGAMKHVLAEAGGWQTFGSAVAYAPQGYGLGQAMSGSGPDDAWDVGFTTAPDGGSEVLSAHWDGTAWNQVPIAGGSFLEDVWDRAPNDVWAVGSLGSTGAILHWDGTSWSPSASPPTLVSSVWASAADDAWAAAGMLLHWDGTTWSPAIDAPSGYTYRAVRGSGPNDVWAVGSANEVPQVTAHWDGASWTTLPFNPDPYGKALWVTGPGDAWLVGDYVHHWTGQAWTTVSIPSPQPVYVGVWASGPTDVWIFGDGVSHWDGNAWSFDPSLGPFSVWGSGPHDLWAYWSNCLLHHE